MTWRARSSLALVAFGTLCAGCPGAPKEGPPPAESLEAAVAAPHALGALAGGTDAAPRALIGPVTGRPPPDDPPEDDDEVDGGVAPAPDAGRIGPEDLPL